jgi:hypothetical protein
MTMKVLNDAEAFVRGRRKRPFGVRFGVDDAEAEQCARDRVRDSDISSFIEGVW